MTNQTLPPGSQPDYGPPPQPPKPGFRRRHPKIFWALVVLAGLVVLSIIIGALSPAQTSVGSEDDPTATTKPTTAAAKKSAPAPAKSGPGIGDEARDGKFAFTVHKVKCGVKRLGDQVLNAEAQGQFCLVSLTVKNIGDEPQTMFSADQKAFIGETQYAADDTATIYTAKGGNSPWLKEINPGNALIGTIVFDIPAGKKLTKFEFHDSGFSDGVDVTLD